MSLPRLPLSLIDLTLAQASAAGSRQLGRSALLSAVGRPKSRSRAGEAFAARRKAHALAFAARDDYTDHHAYGREDGSGREGRGEQENSSRTAGRRKRKLVPARYSVSPKSISKDVGGSGRAYLADPLHPVSLLRSRVEGLVSQSAVKDEPEPDSPEPLVYAEGQLQELYTDLLAHPEPEVGEAALSLIAQSGNLEREERERILTGVARRFSVDDGGQEAEGLPRSTRPSFAARLAARRTQASGSVVPERSNRPPLDLQKMHHRILSRVADVVGSLESARKATMDSASVSVAVLSQMEYASLVQQFVEEDDLNLAEYALVLIQRSGNIPSEQTLDNVLSAYASRGDVPAVEAFLSTFTLEGKPTERQRDLHIKAHLKSSSPEYNAGTALATLHKYESLALLPPIPSYTRLITALFSTHSTQAHAQAWDLFAHMRYVAHPQPDALLYALMIRACAGTGASQSGYASEPERALDLWTEMTLDARIEPTRGAYNAVILACARSKKFVHDAFRLAKEMLDAHRDAFGRPRMHPDRATFAALLVAAKTRGDLARARWILAEMIRYREQAKGVGELEVSPVEEVHMVHVFHAYASYRPPFRRGETKIVESPRSPEESVASDRTQAIKEGPDAVVRFTVTPPQTQAAVVAEATALFKRLLEDVGKATEGTAAPPPLGAFSHVKLTPKLLNSYLSVYYSHAPLEEALLQFKELFPRLHVERSPRSYVEALERCAIAAGEHERCVARAFSEVLWSEWSIVENTLDSRGSTARLIERAHVAMIKIIALSDDIDRALSLVRAFAQRYPAQTVKTFTPKPEMRSTRTVLFAPRPLIRILSPTEVQDDAVPPLLTFRDLELLHHRLATSTPARKTDLAYVKWLCKSYEGAVRKRRDQTLRA